MNLFICGQKAFGAAVFDACLQDGHSVVGVCAPLSSERDPGKPDRLRRKAVEAAVPVIPSGTLSSDSFPAGVELILSAHSHDFIGRRTRNKSALGAIGYHPSLLPLHRGRDAVRWAVRMGDAVTGGSIYWLDDNVDGGPIAAQRHCLIAPGETPEDLWRDKLFPLGVYLFRRVLSEISSGHIHAVPQDEPLSTWEPSWSRPPLRRPDLLMIGRGSQNCYTIHREDDSGMS